MSKKSREPTKKDVFDLIIAHVQKEGWAALNLAEVARKAGISLDLMYIHFPTKMQVLEYLIHLLDHACLSQAQDVAVDETPRDRLFSVLMGRFDVMEPYRDLLRAIQADVWMEPWNFLCLMPPLLMSMGWMLNVAGIDTTGLAGSVRIKIYLVVYLTLIPTWLGDESADLSATMAAVDRALERLAQVPSFYPL